jgi:hypothetical protein
MTVLAAHDSMPEDIHVWYFFACKNCARSSSVMPGGSGSFPAGNSGATKGKEVMLALLVNLLSKYFVRVVDYCLAEPSLCKH